MALHTSFKKQRQCICQLKIFYAFIKALSPGGSEDRQHFHSLRELNLSDNNIGPDGCMIIANYLRSKANTTAKCPLQRLNLRNNNAGDDGAVAISSALLTSHHQAAIHLLAPCIDSLRSSWSYSVHERVSG